jgi:pimeloyl-ACP methyl ester carboxylesterase
MKPCWRLAAGLLFALSFAPPFAQAGAQEAASTQRFHQVHGARLYVETSGHGPPVLFLHGGMMFFDSGFARQRDYFAARHTVIGIDQRGHGHSPDGPWELSYAGMAQDTAAIIEQLRVGPVDVVGHSDGADIALILARDHPQLVRRVVVSGANLRSDMQPSEEKFQALAARLPPWFRSDYARVSPDGADHFMAMLAKCYRMWAQPLVIEPADLKKIAAPVLVIAGDHDFASIEDTTEIFRGLPHGRLLILPDTGHGTFKERPGLINLAIGDFLGEAIEP